MGSIKSTWLPWLRPLLLLLLSCPWGSRGRAGIALDEPNVDASVASDSWLIFPGTKWCGSGDNAEDYEDLGTESETDKCCRKHDYCPDIIEAKQNKHGLKNTASYTRLHCNCDNEFKDCLMKANTKVSKSVGVTYFDALNTKCFQEEHPIVECEQYALIDPRRCLKYKLNKGAPKEWQWFDVPFYYP